MSTTRFCALCTSDTGPFAQRPLGRGDALVSVCRACDEEPPRQGNYSFGGGTRPEMRIARLDGTFKRMPR